MTLKNRIKRLCYIHSCSIATVVVVVGLFILLGVALPNTPWWGPAVIAAAFIAAVFATVGVIVVGPLWLGIRLCHVLEAWGSTYYFVTPDEVPKEN